jgi:hypothetical protein
MQKFVLQLSSSPEPEYFIERSHKNFSIKEVDLKEIYRGASSSPGVLVANKIISYILNLKL